MFNTLNCNMFGEKDLALRTLRSAVYYVRRFHECCDNRTYREHRDNMEACMSNMKKIIAKLEETHEDNTV